MSHSAEHHIEHAEHAAHAAHDNFNTKVTLTIAIIAAVLAGVTIQGHRAHNMTVAAKVEAALLKSESANRWTQFQAYKIRYHNYKMGAEEAAFEAIRPGGEELRDKTIKKWLDRANEYDKKEAPEAKAEAEKFEAKYKELKDVSDHWHHRAERMDLGDLGLQLGIVLASMSILTKRKAFWLTGIACAVVGFAVAMTGQFDIALGGHGHDSHAEKTDHGPESPKH